MTPADPAGAFDAFLPRALERSAAQPEWNESDGPLPTLFLSHGAPPLFDDAEWINELFEWGQRMPKPKAILAVSAHWEAAHRNVLDDVPQLQATIRPKSTVQRARLFCQETIVAACVHGLAMAGGLMSMHWI